MPAALQQPEVADLKPLFCWATPVPDEYANNKSGYTACVAGPDGKVYLGTANYYDYGDWLAYDPRDRSIERVVNLSQTIAENLYDINTQGKTPHAAGHRPRRPHIRRHQARARTICHQTPKSANRPAVIPAVI